MAPMIVSMDGKSDVRPGTIADGRRGIPGPLSPRSGGTRYKNAQAALLFSASTSCPSVHSASADVLPTAVSTGTNLFAHLSAALFDGTCMEVSSADCG